MLFSFFTDLANPALFLLRVVVASVFITSGYAHAKNPQERGADIGMSPLTTTVIGMIEIIGGTMLVLGLLPQIAALLLSGVMLGAITKKLLVWQTGYFSESGYGWHYDLLLLSANLIFLTIGVGS